MKWRRFFESLDDVLVIEGTPPAVRRHAIVNALQSHEPGQWVMLANANRPEYWKERALLIEKAVKVETFDENEGGSKFRIVEFYKMPGRARKAKEDESRQEPEEQE